MINPVVVVGMHRSGTSLVSRLLDRSGVLMGKDLQTDHESKFFIGLNRWIYANAGADWARPEALSELIDFEPAMQSVVEYIKTRISSSASRNFSGRKLKNGLFDLSDTWGWKDPRTGPALPIWLSIWPEMKIVHVLRHGVDVAASLHSRNKRHWSKDVTRFERWLPVYRWRRSRSPIRRGQRVATLENALDFWAEQVRIETSLLENKDRVFRIRFEDILNEPDSSIDKLLDFANIEASSPLLEELKGTLNPRRAFSFRKDPDLLQFAERSSELLGRFGY